MDFTALYLACCRGHVEIVSLLVNAQASVIIPDKVHINIKLSHRIFRCISHNIYSFLNVQQCVRKKESIVVICVLTRNVQV